MSNKLSFSHFRPSFNNQLKSGFPKRYHYVNTKLEVRKVPRELNNITQLNEHFSKFGTIVNIQVKYIIWKFQKGSFLILKVSFWQLYTSLHVLK